MISFDEAVERIRRSAIPIATERVPVGDAAGRVLAEPVLARIDSPRSDVSAMDGYALREADLQVLPAKLRIAGESFPGTGWSGQLGPGECVRIFTGAPIPNGADRVVMQENVQRDGETAIISQHPGDSRHIRRCGGDFSRGDELLSAGDVLNPRALVAVAAADYDSLELYTPPRVSILGTGDELVLPGTASASEDAIPESVSFGVAALAESWGASVNARRRVGDELGPMQKVASEAAADSDLVVVTGGASVGEKDFAKAMFEPLGLELIFSKVAIKPGKPVWLGRVGKTWTMGLPGNPTSALVTARLLLVPLLCVLTGRDINSALAWRSAPLASAIPACGGRETFHRARWSGEEVELLSFQDSSAQKALSQADLLVRQRAHASALARGETVKVLDF